MCRSPLPWLSPCARDEAMTRFPKIQKRRTLHWCNKEVPVQGHGPLSTDGPRPMQRNISEFWEGKLMYSWTSRLSFCAMWSTKLLCLIWHKSKCATRLWLVGSILRKKWYQYVPMITWQREPHPSTEEWALLLTPCTTRREVVLNFSQAYYLCMELHFWNWTNGAPRLFPGAASKFSRLCITGYCIWLTHHKKLNPRYRGPRFS